MPSSTPTQKQIASHLGVSHQVVSYALNGTGRVSEATRERVLRTATQMGYQPNKAAQAMVTGRANQVALWIYSLTQPDAVRIQEAVRAVVNASGFDLVVRSGHQPYPPNSLLDGMLALTSPTLDESSSLEWAQGVPLVMMGVLPNVGVLPCDSVGVEVYESAEQAVHHLFENGCRRVAYLAVSDLMCDADPRCGAYRTVMQEKRRKVEEIPVVNDAPIRTASHQALLQYIQEHGAPDGLLCGNDNTAIGAQRALRELGLRVPKDVKIVGCDDTPDGADANPPLSSISLSIEDMCSRAWQLMQQRLDTPEMPLQHITLNARFIPRDSSQ